MTGDEARQWCIETGRPILARVDAVTWVMYCPPVGIPRGGYSAGSRDEAIDKTITTISREGWPDPLFVEGVLAEGRKHDLDFGKEKRKHRRKQFVRETKGLELVEIVPVGI